MNRPYVDIWSWFNRFGRQAGASGDESRIRLWKIFDTAFALQEKQPEQALALFREAADLAERLNEPCMTLFYEHWIGEVLVYHLSRYEDGLDLSVRLMAKTNHEAYRDCPLKAWVFISLITGYHNLDALSYVDEIRAMIETMETSMPLDRDTHQRLRFYRADLWREMRQLDQAVSDMLAYLEMSGSNAFRQTDGYHLLCHVSYLQNDDQKALEYAHLTEEKALRARRFLEVTESTYWQALLLHLRGEFEEGERLFLLGSASVNTFARPKELSLLCAMARYYEARGEFEKSLALWDDQIRLMNPGTPHRQTYFYIFLRRCFVLRRLGRLTNADVERTHHAAQNLRKPQAYLNFIDELNDGHTDIPRY